VSPADCTASVHKLNSQLPTTDHQLHPSEIESIFKTAMWLLAVKFFSGYLVSHPAGGFLS